MVRLGLSPSAVAPAQAGAQKHWIPAFAGMTVRYSDLIQAHSLEILARLFSGALVNKSQAAQQLLAGRGQGYDAGGKRHTEKAGACSPAARAMRRSIPRSAGACRSASTWASPAATGTSRATAASPPCSS